MTGDPAKTPLRMTATEFVTAMAIMAGAAKLSQKPRKPRYAQVKREVIQGKFRWIKNDKGERTKFPVYAITLTSADFPAECGALIRANDDGADWMMIHHKAPLSFRRQPAACPSFQSCCSEQYRGRRAAQ